MSSLFDLVQYASHYKRNSEAGMVIDHLAIADDRLTLRDVRHWASRLAR